MGARDGIKILLDLEGYNGKSDEYVLAYMKPFLNAVTAANVMYLKRHPRTPLIYQSGVKWRRENIPVVASFDEPNPNVHWKDCRFIEIWKDIPAILRDGADDCEGMTCWRAAELRVRFNRPMARPILRVRNRPNGSRLFHIVVGDGEAREDPSRILGMGLPEAY